MVLLLMAGCVSPVPDAAPERSAAAAPRDEGGFLPNELLLDAPRPPGGRVHGGSEPMVLTDHDGEWIWVGSTGGAARSRDNGTTWQQLSWPFLLSADGWSLAQDDVGRLYVSTTGTAYAEVYRSDDDGETWIRPGLPFRPPLSGAVDVAPIADRPWIAARGDGEIMLILYDYGRTFSESCARSSDGGVTWLDRDPKQGVPNAGRPDFDASGRFGYTGSNGHLYLTPAAPALPSHCLTPPMQVRMFENLGVQPMLHTSATGEAFFSAAPTASNAAIQLSGHRAGATKTIVVSPPVLRSNVFATVSAHGDDVAVAWYATETAGNWRVPGFQGSWNVYVARVADFWGNETIELTRLTTEPNHVGDICTSGIGCTGDADRDLLDYFGIEHDARGALHVAYVHDGSTSNAEVRHAWIG